MKIRRLRGRYMTLVASIVVLALVSVACSKTTPEVVDPPVTTTEAPHHDDESTDGVRVVEISMTEFSFTPSVVAVEAGETIKFVVTNNGVAPHEFEVTTQYEIDEHINGGHENHGGSMPEMVGSMKLELGPGKTGELTVTFNETEQLFFVCLIPGHYEAGMVGEIDLGDEAPDHNDHDEQENDH